MNNRLDNMSRSVLYEEIERLQTYVKDAERYRWLRHGDNDEQVMDLNGSDDVYMLRNEKLDTAIDVAMAEENSTAPITKYDKKLREHLALVEDIKEFLADHARHNHHWIDDEVIIDVFSYIKPKKVKKALKDVRGE